MQLSNQRFLEKKRGGESKLMLGKSLGLWSPSLVE
jgi:hypothetical protein